MSKEYNKYLDEHRANVTKAFYWMQTNLPDLLSGGYDYERQITAAHDKSKSNFDEYQAYDDYFYGKDQSYEVKQAFNKAWLTHIHRNPHHWQYWILVNDDPNEGEVLIDMPYNYIIEMICDWWGFSFKQGKLDEIFNWYNEHKKYMKLSDKTKTKVEYILAEINKKLEGMND
jgi:hypothetical protein